MSWSTPATSRAAENSDWRNTVLETRLIDVVEQGIGVVVGNGGAHLGHCRAEVLIERERRRLPTRVVADAADLVELLVGDVPVGDHHEQQQLDHRLVFAVGRGVHRNVTVQIAQMRWFIEGET